MSSLYTVSVPPGTWVPVSLSVTNREASGVDGAIVVDAPALEAGLSTPGCLSNGPSTFTCLGSEDYAPNAPTVNGSNAPNASIASNPGTLEPRLRSEQATVTYSVPLFLATGTAKRLPLYVLAGPPGERLSARVQLASGRVLARAYAQLPVAYGLAGPAVLVVTDNPSGVPVLTKLVAPTGAQPELQYMAPSDLPTMPAALGAFKAVVIDQADTSGLSPAQSQALEGYVDAGGTLVVAGGLGWRGATAGLPAGFLPGRPTGNVSSLALPGLASLLGAGPIPARVDVDSLDVTTGATETVTQGRAPLVLEASRGSGHVVFCAFDPAVAPLAAWSGTPVLLSRLFAPAYQPGYYDSPLPYAEAGGVFPVPPAGATPSVVAKLGGNFDTGSALMSPVTAVSVLAGYLEQAPAVTRPPAVSFLGLLLLGYIVVVGLVLLAITALPARTHGRSSSFKSHVQARRRALVGVVVPALAIIGVLSTGVAGVGGGSGPLVQEIRVSQLPPDGHMAQVVSMGMVQLPNGGSRRIELSSPSADGGLPTVPALVGNLAAGAGVGVSVGQGRAPLSSSVTVNGRARSRGGWSASESVHLAGSVTAHTNQSGDFLVGVVDNHLRVKLIDAEVVVASGEATVDLGTLEPGRSVRFELVVPPNSSPLAQAFGAPAPVVSDQPGASASSPAKVTAGRAAPTAASSPPAAGAGTGAQREVGTALGDLAASYSTEQGGAPVFVAMAAHNLFRFDASAGAERPVVTDVVVVPLTNSQGHQDVLTNVPGELVGSTGVTGETEYAITTGSLTLQAGGAFDYQFLLPDQHWRRLELDLGSSSGETYGPPLVGLKAYNYSTGHWDTLQPRAHSGELLAQVPDVAHYLGPGGTLEVKVVAEQDGVEVYGGFPTLSATSAGASRAGRIDHGHNAPARATPARATPARTTLAHAGLAP
jgi:hypothetical protein